MNSYYLRSTLFITLAQGLLLLLLTMPIASAQTPGFLIRAGANADDYGAGTATDGAGNVYVTGYFHGTATFGNTTLSTTGTDDSDIFVAKYDASGSLLWARRAGGSADDQGYGIAVDNSGVYVTGFFNGTANFNTPSSPASNTLTSAGAEDIFVAKYDASGSLIWARRAGGSSNDDSYGIAVDNGGVYITGTFWGTPNFNTPSSPASNTLTSAGTIDIFVAKYDASGSLVWARRAGGIGGDYGIGIAVNNSEVYVTGAFMGTANFNTPSSPASNTLTAAGAEDIFVAKYDASGNLIWARRAGANSVNNSGSGIAVDNSGVYITGYFNGTADFNTPSSPASNTLASAGATDIFVAKYDASGNLVWARRAGGSSNNDFGNGIAVDNGEVYVTGSISGIANFNTPSSPASNTLTVAGSFDIFVAKYDASGNLVWARRAGGSNIDSGSGIAVNNSGVYVTGAFQGTTDFNTPSSPASNTLTSAGGYDIFLSQWITSPAPTITGFATTATTVCVGSPVTFTATVGNVTGNYAYTLTNGSSPIIGTTTSTAFSQTVTASGSGLQSFSLLVSDNGNTSFASTTINVGAHPDYQPLVDLYNATNRLGWHTNTGWLQGCDPCTGTGGSPWYGVTCSGGRVIQLSLSSNLLNGSIPASLSALTNLQTLALSLNPLSGSIPSSLSALTNLQSLDLAGSQLSGNIPSSLGTLTNLQSLNLGGNGLSGSIPVSLGALTNLQSLDLSNNHLSGSIPASLSAMTNLQTLILNNNQLSGCWPASLSALCGVRFKDFSSNAGLPDGGSSTAFNTFCSTGQGSDAFVASALASSTTATVGDVVSLSTSGGSSYSWTAPTGANLSSPGTTSVVSATINQTGVQTFTVVVNNGGTCSQTATVSVTVSTLAPSIVNFSPDPDPVCPGSQVTFTALIRNVTGSYAYTLTNGTTTISGTSSAPNFSQTITAQSTNTRQAELQSFSLIVSSNGQSAIETYELSVHDLPSLTLTAGNGGVIGCNVTSLTLTAKGGDDYRFNGPGVFSQDSENGVAVINTAGVYSVTVTSANGCTATTSTSVFSNTATVTVSNPVVTTAAVGLGFSQSFTATGGTAPYTYTLISGTLPTGLTFVTTGALSGTPTQSGIFSITVRASDANGCSATGTLYTVAVSTTATVITATPTNVQATSAVLGGSVTADGGASVTERGVIYIVGNGIPTTSDTKVAIGSGVGSFTQSVTGLTSNTAYSVRAYAINAAGTSYGNVQLFTTLSGPPAPLVSTPIDGSRLSVNTPTYSGTATPGSSVTIFVDGSNVGQTTANAGGNWTFTSVNALTDASHAVYAQATLDGLDSPNSTTITFTIDTTSPIAPVVTAPLNGDILSDNTPTYAGTAEPSSTVTVLVDGSPTGTTTADASGNWSYTPGTPLSDGTHTVRARAMDNVGNTGPTSATTTFTIDTTHPTVTISSSAPNPTNTGPILLSMTFSELVTGFVAGDISVNNGTLSDFAGSGSLYTATLTPTAAGLVSVSVSANVAQDAAGNMNQASTVFTIQYLPNAILTGFAATATTVCVGSPVTFTATVENVTGSYNYTLTNGSASSLTGSTTNTAFSQTVTASGSGLQSFSLLVSDNGQLGSGMTSVTINSLPMATILTPASTTLTCSTTSISLTATGGGTYQWEDNSTNAIRSVTTPNTYTVTVTGSNGCTALATTSIFSNTVLSLEAGPSLPQANVGVVLSLTATGATTYQWSAPSTASLTTPATGSAVSASLTTAGLQTFTVVGTTGACSQSSLVSVTALPGPDLSATLSLPDANFPASSSKDLLVQVQEVNGSAATGNIVITLTVPTGYSVSFDNSLTSINVSGGSTNPVSVQNSKWQVSSRVAGRQLSLVINSGESVGAKGTLSLGFSITRTTATGGSVSNITINVADDSGGQYDVNRLNNVYARIINSL